MVAGGVVPSNRSGHSAAVVGSQLYVFGGYEQRYLSEVVVLDTGSNLSIIARVSLIV